MRNMRVFSASLVSAGLCWIWFMPFLRKSWYGVVKIVDVTLGAYLLSGLGLADSETRTNAWYFFFTFSMPVAPRIAMRVTTHTNNGPRRYWWRWCGSQGRALASKDLRTVALSLARYIMVQGLSTFIRLWHNQKSRVNGWLARPFSEAAVDYSTLTHLKNYLPPNAFAFRSFEVLHVACWNSCTLWTKRGYLNVVIVDTRTYSRITMHDQPKSLWCIWLLWVCGSTLYILWHETRLASDPARTVLIASVSNLPVLFEYVGCDGRTSWRHFSVLT